MEHAELLKLEEFWPVEHPLEPQDEDRPVKCPMHSPSSLLNDSRMQEDSFRKRAEVPVEINREGIDVNITEAPIRAVRKRHHTHTNDYHNTDLTRMPPVPSLQMQTQKITIFEMLQDFDKFES